MPTLNISNVALHSTSDEHSKHRPLLPTFVGVAINSAYKASGKS